MAHQWSGCVVSGILAAMAGSGGTIIQFSITAGTDGTNIGFSSLTTIFGSITTPSGGTLPSGKTIKRIADFATNGANFAVGGLGADPGQNSLSSITSNGHTYTGASATYSFSGGNSIWTWGSTNKFGYVNGNNYSGVINKNTGAW